MIHGRRGIYFSEIVGHVWLTGDNFNNSLDSRKYGAIPEGLIVGRVFCKLRPQFPFVFKIEDRKVHSPSSNSDDEEK